MTYYDTSELSLLFVNASSNSGSSAPSSSVSGTGHSRFQSSTSSYDRRNYYGGNDRNPSPSSRYSRSVDSREENKGLYDGPKRPRPYLPQQQQQQQSGVGESKPINYQFKPMKNDERNNRDDEQERDSTDVVDIKSIMQEEAEGKSNLSENSEEEKEETYSQRKYKTEEENNYYKNRTLNRYLSTRRGKLSIMSSSTCLGLTFGYFISKSSLGFLPQISHQYISLSFAFLFLIMSSTMSWTRPTNDYSVFIKILGLTFWILFKRSKEIWKKYPTRVHVACILRPKTYSRRTFPPLDVMGYDGDEDEAPIENPWKYEGEEFPDYSMIQILLSMMFIGGLCGGNIPIIPTWMGSLSGAASFCFLSTLKDSKGDLTRSMGMKIVSLIQELLYLNEDLGVLSQGKVVTEKVLDKLLILDRKHKIRDKVGRGAKVGYESLMRTVNRVRADAQGETPPPDDNRDRDRDRNRDRERERNDPRRVDDNRGRREFRGERPSGNEQPTDRNGGGRSGDTDDRGEDSARGRGGDGRRPENDHRYERYRNRDDRTRDK